MNRLSVKHILAALLMVAILVFGFFAIGEKYGLPAALGVAALLVSLAQPGASFKLGANLALNQNQTFQTPMLAMVTMDPQPNTIPAQIYPSSTATVIVAGCAVKLVNNVGPNVQVDVCTSQSDGPIFGVIPYNMRKNTYGAGDPVEVCGRGSILMLKTYAAVQRGVALVNRNPAAATDDPMVESNLTIGNYILGSSLGYAAAGSGLIKVQVAPGIVSATGVISVTTP